MRVRIVLQDPNADEDALLIVDRIRFEDAWSGDVVLIKRNYETHRRNQAVQPWACYRRWSFASAGSCATSPSVR